MFYLKSFTAFADPEVAAAFKDISSNPANIMKYQNNPKVMALVTKMAGKMGAGGPGGGAGGGMPGMGGLGGDTNIENIQASSKINLQGLEA